MLRCRRQSPSERALVARIEGMQAANSCACIVGSNAQRGPPMHVRNFGCNSQIQDEIHAEHLSLLGKRCSSGGRMGGRGGELSNDLAQPFLYLSYN